MITEERLSELIEEGESEYCDFKLVHHRDKAELIHDILCLSNSPSGSNRYIIFGIRDSRDIAGIKGEGRNMNYKTL